MSLLQVWGRTTRWNLGTGVEVKTMPWLSMSRIPNFVRSFDDSDRCKHTYVLRS